MLACMQAYKRRFVKDGCTTWRSNTLLQSHHLGIGQVDLPTQSSPDLILRHFDLFAGSRGRVHLLHDLVEKPQATAHADQQRNDLRRRRTTVSS